MKLSVYKSTPLLTTRFNESTWRENMAFRSKNEWPCIYAVSQPITERMPIHTLAYVIEMNNELNQIEGIGLIRNEIDPHRYKVYENLNWNRFCYKGKYHMHRAYLLEENPRLVHLLDTLLFKGKAHMKRGIGMTLITEKIKKRFANDTDANALVLEEAIRTLFLQKYREKIPHP